MPSVPPLRVEVVGPVQAAIVPWRHAGQRSLTVVVKASFGLEEGQARLVAPDPLHGTEQLVQGGRTPWHDSDLAPYKPRADVTYVGQAWSPQPVQQLRVRLGVQSQRAQLDKSIVIVGDQHARGAPPAPFQRMPLGWERSWADPQGLNPVGVTPESGRLPNLYDPLDGRRPTSLGPIGRSWPHRSRMLAMFDPRFVDAAEPEVPNAMPWGYYCAAPPDQQIEQLSGDETIYLEYLVEGAPRLRSVLPGAQGKARLFGVDGSSMGAQIELRLDTLAIDGVRRIASLVWRGSIQRPDDASLARASVAVGLELPGRPVSWPSSTSASAATRSMPSAVSPTQSLPAVPPRAPMPSSAPVESKTEAFVLPKGLPKLHDDDMVTYDLDDDPASGASTMAIDPDVVARALAQRGAMPFGKAPPPAPPPPAPPPPAPPPPVKPPPLEPPPAATERTGVTNVIVRPAQPSVHDFAADDSDEAVAATLAVTPEAAAELIARRRSELEAQSRAGGSPMPPGVSSPPPRIGSAPSEAELARNGTVMIPAIGARTPPPAPPPPSPPPPVVEPGPKKTQKGTLVIELPDQGLDARDRKR